MKRFLNVLIVIVIAASCTVIVFSVKNLKKDIKLYEEKYINCVGLKSESDFAVKLTEQKSTLLDDLWLSRTNPILLETLYSNEKINLNSFSNEFTLIYWFDHQKACNACVDEAIKDLVEFSEIVGSENVALITNYDEIKQLRILKTKFDVSFSCFKTKEIIHNKLLEHANVNQLLFVLNKDSKILFPFIISPKNSISELYLNKVTSLIN